jgi:hypothetical protein
MGATALLYLGPLFAGLAGQGWAVVPVFVVIFVIAQIIRRPRDYPRDLAGWAQRDVLIRALTRLLVQVVLVMLGFGIGRGFGGVAGILPPFPESFPVLLSLLSIPLASLIWNPSDPEVLEEELSSITAPLPPLNLAEEERALANALTAPLLDLPEETTAETLEQHLRAMARHAPARALHESLAMRVRPRTASEVIKRAYVLHGTDPVTVREVHPVSVVAKAFATAKTDQGLLGLFVPRALALIDSEPNLWPGFPKTRDLRRAAQATKETGLEMGLTALADALEKVAPKNPLE